MIEKAKTTAKAAVKKTTRLILPRKKGELTPEDVRVARDYIAAFWPRLERFHPKDDESLLGVPKPYLVPSYDETASFDYNELYYWDSYFMADRKSVV